ncbi:FtsX-like permease family protein [Nocardioides sp. BGMRC 2183]|nr:FtsX-like permease family protein [Nocardioides sp. BGMRC 2183]
MRTALLASLRHHTRRYVASGLAVVIGVAFIVVTGILTGATREGLTADVGAPVAGVDTVATVDDPQAAQRLLDEAAARDVPALGLGYAMEPVARDGVQLAASADIGEASLTPSLQWQELEEGRFPATAGEALADVNAAKRTDVGVGDVLRVGTGAAAREVEVVGMVDSPAALGASLYVPWQVLSGFDGTLWIDAVAWGGSADLAREIAPAAELEPATDWVAERQAEIARGVDVIAIMALIFVVIALVVAVLVIANTFAILFAQRQRDFALLRCVGVTRRQLRRSVRVEALLLGIVASLTGVAGGIALGFGAVALVRHWFADMGTASLPPVWLAAGFTVGVLVTVAAAWMPTRSVTRVAPLAALRPDTGVDVRSAAGRGRLTLAALALVGGVTLLVLAVLGHQVPLMLAGGTAAFIGVLLFGPVLVPALIRLVGRLPGAGPVRRLATGNAVRNPRRTATTAASLLIGVTLTTAVLTGLASSRTALDVEMDASYPLDATVTAATDPLETGLADRATALDGVDDAVTLEGTFARAADVRLPLVGVGTRPAVVRGPDDLVPRDGQLLLPIALVEELPKHLADQVYDDATLTLRVAGRPITLDTVVDDGWGRSGLVSAATLARIDPDPQPVALWVRAADGADPEDLQGDLAALAGASGAALEGGYGNRSWVDLQVDVLTGAVVSLLGIAIAISLVGIGNTLGLSVLERGRENALLRALGLTRRQLRRAMAVEGLLLAGVASLLGAALGLAFARVGVEVMVQPAVEHVVFAVPVVQVAAVVGVAALAGLAACVLPARRAARVAPAAGLALE